MCELFGLCAAEKYRVNELLDAFFHHSVEHKDGWGLAVFYGKGVSMEKEPVRALDSIYLRQRMTREIAGTNLMAHIRLATIGRMEYANCHPFIWDDNSGRTWTMIHNGTLFAGDKLAAYQNLQEGTTDSERLLLHIVHEMNAAIDGIGEAPDTDCRFRILDRIMTDLALGNKLNMILYDGEVMYVHSNCADSLHMWKQDDRVIFSTKPLLFEKWEEFPQNQLFAFRNGRQIAAGTNHGHAFHEEEYDMTSLFSAFSEL